MTLVALSAAYGTLGSKIGQGVAEALGVPFLDRAIPMAVAARLDVPVDEAAAHDEQISMLERILRGFIGIDLGVPAPPAAERASPDDFRRATEEVLLRQAATRQGVILGRGAVVVLREQHRVLRVRLTGPPDRRLALAIAAQQEASDPVRRLDPADLERHMRQLDRMHATYMKYFYGVNIDDPLLYHVTIDSTALPAETCVELIAAAAATLATTRRSPFLSTVS
jgi:cytidylate kinase